MGQAKARGTFEQRRAEAIERDKKRAEELRILEGQRWESLTDEEKRTTLKHERYERNLISTLFGRAGLIGHDYAGFWNPPKLKRHHIKGNE